MKKYYIAYGKNLNYAQMKCRCPTAKMIGNAVLKDYQLLFRCYATVENVAGSSVQVVVWEIDEETEKSLDFYQEYPKLHRKEYVDIIVNNKKINAMIYIINENIMEYGLPSIIYLSIVLEGYSDMKLNKKCLKNGICKTKKIIEGSIV